jgi:hypothetical protein
VIQDSADRISPPPEQQSRSFDAAAYDTRSWPCFAVHGDGPNSTRVLCIEGVRWILEVKTTITCEELNDSFEKARSVLALQRTYAETSARPLITLFGYGCDNVELTFFDFVRQFARDPATSLSSVCILGSACIMLAREEPHGLTLANDPSRGVLPVLVATGEDSLARWYRQLLIWQTHNDATWDERPSRIANVLDAYMPAVLADTQPFFFEHKFIEALCTRDESVVDMARSRFQRKFDRSTDLAARYQLACKDLELV